jgi:signal transduction histidine kinase
MTERTVAPGRAAKLFLVAGAVLLSFSMLNDHKEAADRELAWSTMLRSVAASQLGVGDLVRLSALLRSEPRFSVLVCDSDRAVLLGSGEFRNRDQCSSNAGHEQPLLWDSRIVGFLIILPIPFWVVHIGKYTIIVTAWLSAFIALSAVLRRRADLLAIDALTSSVSKGELIEVPRVDGAAQKIQELAEALVESGHTQRRLHAVEIENQKNRARAELAMQVAHDIRSPIGALLVVESHLSGVEPAIHEILKGVIQRISGIAADILGAQPKRYAPIAAWFERFVAEKRLEIEHRSLGVRLEAKIEANAAGLTSELEVISLQRILSNLINNAAEAAHEGALLVHCFADKGSESLILEVSDSGPGFPQHVLKRNPTEPLASSKDGGHGLGLLGCHRLLTEVGGTLTLFNGGPLGGAVVRVAIPAKVG